MQTQKVAQYNEGQQIQKINLLEAQLAAKEVQLQSRVQLEPVKDRGLSLSPTQSQKHSQDSHGDYQAIKRRNEELSAELNLKNVDISNLKIELDKTHFQVRNLEDQKDELTKNLQRRSNQLEMVEKVEIKLKDELARLRSEYDQTNAKCITVSSDFHQSQEKLLHQEREHERLMAKLGQFEKIYASLEQKEKEFFTLEKKLDAVQHSEFRLKDEVECLKQELKIASEKLMDFKSENNRLHDKIGQLTRVNEDDVYKLQREIRSLQDTNERLQKKSSYLHESALSTEHPQQNFKHTPISPPTMEQRNSQLQTHGESSLRTSYKFDNSLLQNQASENKITKPEHITDFNFITHNQQKLSSLESFTKTAENHALAHTNTINFVNEEEVLGRNPNPQLEAEKNEIRGILRNRRQSNLQDRRHDTSLVDRTPEYTRTSMHAFTPNQPVYPRATNAAEPPNQKKSPFKAGPSRKELEDLATKRGEIENHLLQLQIQKDNVSRLDFQIP